MEMYSKELLDILSEDTKTPGEFLKKIMKTRGLTCKSLSESLGTSYAYLCMIMNDYNIPDTKGCLNISTALGIDPYYFNRICADQRMKN